MKMFTESLLAIRAEWLDNALGMLENDAYTLQPLGSAWGETATASASDFERRGTVALLPVRGVMEKRSSYWSYFFGGCSTEALIRATKAIKDDASITACVPIFDTPGGVVGGTADFAQALADLDRVKPVVGYVADQCCSAGMWAASSCRELYGNTTAIVGSIGILHVVRDTSEAAAKYGAKIHAIGSSPFKGMGTPGTPLTEAQRAEYQRIINSLFVPFKAAIQQGRGLTNAQTDAIADARVWVAPEAVANGLLDGIGTLESTLERAGVLAGTPWRWHWPQQRKGAALNKLSALMAQLGASAADVSDILSEFSALAEHRALIGTASASNSLQMSAAPTGTATGAVPSLKGNQTMSTSDASSFSNHVIAIYNDGNAIMQRLQSQLTGASSIHASNRYHQMMPPIDKAVADLRELRQTSITNFGAEAMSGPVNLLDKHLAKCGRLLAAAQTGSGPSLEKLIDSLTDGGRA